MLSATMSYDDFRDTDLVREPVEDFADFTEESRVFHHGSVDETPDIASEVCWNVIFSHKDRKR